MPQGMPASLNCCSHSAAGCVGEYRREFRAHLLAVMPAQVGGREARIASQRSHFNARASASNCGCCTTPSEICRPSAAVNTAEVGWPL